LAATLSVTLLPSLFDDIFLRPGLLQADGIHPNQKAQRLICDTILQALQPLLQ
jgi:acyl-CoA thioesterase-1